MRTMHSLFLIRAFLVFLLLLMLRVFFFLHYYFVLLVLVASLHKMHDASLKPNMHRFEAFFMRTVNVFVFYLAHAYFQLFKMASAINSEFQQNVERIYSKLFNWIFFSSICFIIICFLWKRAKKKLSSIQKCMILLNFSWTNVCSIEFNSFFIEILEWFWVKMFLMWFYLKWMQKKNMDNIDSPDIGVSPKL